MLNITLETRRLCLRPFRADDVDRVHSYGSLPEFSQYEPWGPNSIEDTQHFLLSRLREQETEPRFRFNFAIALKGDDLLVGACGIRCEAQSSVIANLGWAVAPNHQRQGYASEAAGELIRFGFEDLGAKVIYATCDARNVASYRVMEKVGMTRVGLLIGDKMQKGHLRDTLRYEINAGVAR